MNARRMAQEIDEVWQVWDRAGRRKYLTGDERKRFLEAADRCRPSTRALCYLIANTGCRISEALALTRDHLDRDELTVTFRTLKRRRLVYRTVPIPEYLACMIAPLPRANSERLWNMHRSTAWRQIKAVMDSAKITGTMACPKGLRHGFGVRAIGRGVPPSLVQRWLGHASPRTTAIYLDAVGVEERQFARRLW